MTYRRLTMWTAAHFAVDFGCFLVLFGALKPACMDGPDGLEVLTVGFLLYNILAFGLQPFIGMLCDGRENWRRSCGWRGVMGVSAGCMAAAISMQSAAWGWDYPGLMQGMAWAAMVLCAVGNAAFHVGAGRDVLVRSGGRMTDNGIFVSSGALGVGLGTMLGSREEEVLFYLAFALLSALSLPIGSDLKKESAARPLEAKFCQGRDLPFLTAVGLLFLVIVLRAYAGSIIPLEWERAGLLVLLPSVASCLGKALGGILGDRFGPAETGVGSLVLCLPFVLFGGASPVLSLTGLLLFNMTMPVTLCALADLMPKNPGFAFGLTTLALLVGTAVTFFWAVPAGIAKPMLALLILISAVCIRMTVNDRGKTYEKKKECIYV